MDILSLHTLRRTPLPPFPPTGASAPRMQGPARQDGSQGLASTGWRTAAAGCVLVVCAAHPTAGMAQSHEVSPGIYVCVDAKGRRLTSDRPIMECLDREQRELSSSGVTRRVVPASLTAEERARAQAQAEAEAAQRARDMDQKRRDRALLARYPNQRLHDAEREKQLAQLTGSKSVIEQRQAELRQQQQALHDEMQFYRQDPSKAPAWLKHRVADNASQLATQEQLLANHAQERQRLNARFDEELLRLKQLWGATGGGSAAVAR